MLVDQKGNELDGARCEVSSPFLIESNLRRGECSNGILLWPYPAVNGEEGREVLEQGRVLWEMFRCFYHGARDEPKISVSRSREKFGRVEEVSEREDVRGGKGNAVCGEGLDNFLELSVALVGSEKVIHPGGETVRLGQQRDKC